MPAQENRPAAPVVPGGGDGWTVVAEGRFKVIFDTDGMMFDSYFEGFEIIPNPKYDEKLPETGENAPTFLYLNLRDEKGDGYATSANYQLEKAFAKIPVGTFTRIVRLNQVKAERGNMTNFRVFTRD